MEGGEEKSNEAATLTDPPQVQVPQAAATTKLLVGATRFPQVSYTNDHQGTAKCVILYPTTGTL